MLSSVLRKSREWFANIRRNTSRGEFSGAFGDVGTFIPLFVGLIVKCKLDFTSGLFFAGLFNIITAVMFDVPMAVQPMKAISAVAIAQELPIGQVYAAGICTSAIVGFLGLTRLIDVVNYLVPSSVVKGIQLGTGLSLAMKGVTLISGTNVWFTSSDSIFIGIVGISIVLLLWDQQKVPVALLIFCSGVIIAAVRNSESVHFEFHFLSVVNITRSDFSNGFVSMALPQIPLTTLNSVIAVCSLSSTLFPRAAVQPHRVAVSVAAMNLVSCWFGGMPMCHGASGLASQYRFGARSNVAILFLGAFFVVCSVALGNLPLLMFKSFPNSVLGVLLAVGGAELCVAAREGFRSSCSVSARSPASPVDVRTESPVQSEDDLETQQLHQSQQEKGHEQQLQIAVTQEPEPKTASIDSGSSSSSVSGNGTSANKPFMVMIATAAASLAQSTFVGFLVGMGCHILFFLGPNWRFALKYAYHVALPWAWSVTVCIVSCRICRSDVPPSAERLMKGGDSGSEQSTAAASEPRDFFERAKLHVLSLKPSVPAL